MYSLLKIALLFILLTACVPAMAQATKPATEAGSVSGCVSIGGKGVANAVVALHRVELTGNSTTPPKVTTDREGRYAFNSVAPGQYSIEAFAPAYVFAAGDRDIPMRNLVSVDEGEAVENVDFSLVRGGVITGRVTDTQGKPLIGEKVYIAGADGRPLPDHWHSGIRELFHTDDRGVFRIFGLPAGRYLVGVGELDNGGPVRQTVRPYYRRMYYRDAAEPSQAKIVEVAEGGEVTDIDIAVGRPLKRYTASGRAIDEATGKPVANIVIGSRMAAAVNRYQSSRPRPGADLTAIPDERGNFRLEGLVPGRYVAFTDGGEVGSAAPVAFEITDKDVSGLELRLKQATTINGLAVISGTDSPEATARLGRVQFYAYTTGDPQAAPKEYEIRLNPDGSFRVPGVTPGKLVLHLRPGDMNRNFSILQIERDGVVVSDGVPIAQGDKNVNVKVVFGYGTGKVQGQLKIENGQVPQGAQVWARLYSTGNPTAIQHYMVDARSQFLFEGLASGEYEVIIQAYMLNGSWRKETARQRIAVTGGSASQMTLTLNLAPDKKEDR